MNDKEKMIRISYYVVVAILVLIAAIRIFNIEDFDNPSAADKQKPSMGLYLAYIGIGLASLMWIANFVIKLITEPKSQMWAIGGTVAVVIIFFIAKATLPMYFEGVTFAGAKEPVSAVESVYSSAGLVTMYILIGLSILGAIGTGIKTLFE